MGVILLRVGVVSYNISGCGLLITKWAWPPCRYRGGVILRHNAVLLHIHKPLGGVTATNQGPLRTHQFPGRELCLLLHGSLSVHLQEPPVGPWVHHILICIPLTHIHTAQFSSVSSACIRICPYFCGCKGGKEGNSYILCAYDFA